MKVVYTEDALRNLDGILTFIGANYPAISAAFVTRLRMIERRIGRWPESAEEVEQRSGVRMVPFIRKANRSLSARSTVGFASGIIAETA